MTSTYIKAKRLAAAQMSAQHQSDNQQTALANCLTDVDAVISTYTIWHKTCNPSGGGFRWVVEIRPDPNSWIRYLSIPSK